MAGQTFVPFSWLLFVTFFIPPGGAQAQETSKPYDFWNDSAFDDIYWNSYNGSVSKDTKQSATPEQCVNHCQADEACTSFVYNARTQFCDPVPVVMLYNDASDDPRIRSKEGNRLYRYLPPDKPVDQCPIEKCFYYDRKARACWKLLYGDGPGTHGRYKFQVAKNACRWLGAHMAVIDTQAKFDRAILMLRNNPVLVTSNVWRKLWVGARRLAAQLPVKWLTNGAAVPLQAGYWDTPPSAQDDTGESNKHCLSFSPIPEDKPIDYRFNLNKCNEQLFGVICEMS